MGHTNQDHENVAVGWAPPTIMAGEVGNAHPTHGVFNRFIGVKVYCRMKHRIQILILIILLVSLTSLLCNEPSHAEDKAEEEKKISVEKTEVIGVLERPAVIFPVRWKYPEGQPLKTLTTERSFKEEIFEFIDMETINQEGLWE